MAEEAHAGAERALKKYLERDGPGQLLSGREQPPAAEAGQGKVSPIRTVTHTIL